MNLFFTDFLGSLELSATKALLYNLFLMLLISLGVKLISDRSCIIVPRLRGSEFPLKYESNSLVRHFGISMQLRDYYQWLLNDTFSTISWKSFSDNNTLIISWRGSQSQYD